MNDRDIYQKSYLKYRRKNEGNIKSCGLLFFTVLIIVSLYMAVQFKNYQNFLNTKSKETKTIEIKPGETIDTIAKNLIQEKIIEDNKVFTIPAYKLYLKLNSIDSNNIQVGQHEIKKDSNLEEIFNSFQKTGPACQELKVTLKEGWRVEEYAEELDKTFAGKKNVKFDKSEFIQLARHYKPSGDIKLSFTPPTNLEGYLFPDTYNFCSETTSQGVIDKLLSTFDSKVYIPLKSEIETNRFSLNELITLSSILEREVRTYEVKRNVADILISRIDNGIALGVDATSQYQFGYSEKQKTWWRTGSELDAVIATPHDYNTRSKLGLPPTPISNPGFDSVKAMLEPNPNDYFYYLTSDDGQIHYAKTLSEHNYNTCKYLLKTCK